MLEHGLFLFLRLESAVASKKSRIKPKPRVDYDPDTDSDDGPEYWPEPESETNMPIAAICRGRDIRNGTPDQPHEIWHLCFSEREVVNTPDTDVIWVETVEELAEQLRSRYSGENSNLDYVSAQGHEARVLPAPIWRGPMNVKEIEKYLSKNKTGLHIPMQIQDGRDSRWTKLLGQLQKSAVWETYENGYSRERGCYLITYKPGAGKHRREIEERNAEWQAREEQERKKIKKSTQKRVVKIRTDEFVTLGKALFKSLKDSFPRTTPKETKQHIINLTIKSNGWLTKKRLKNSIYLQNYWGHSKRHIVNGILLIGSYLTLLGNPHHKKPSEDVKLSLTFFLPYVKHLRNKTGPFPKLSAYIEKEAKVFKI